MASENIRLRIVGPDAEDVVTAMLEHARELQQNVTIIRDGKMTNDVIYEKDVDSKV